MKYELEFGRHEPFGAHARDGGVNFAVFSEHAEAIDLCLFDAQGAERRLRLFGPVDGIFYRGSFHFGSSPDSIRFRHIRQRPAVSATHLDGEEFSVTVHGTATEIDLKSPEHAGFRRAVLDVYVPRYGAEWEQFIDSGPVYARIDARRMLTFFMPAGADVS